MQFEKYAYYYWVENIFWRKCDMNERQEGNLFYDRESGRYDIRFGMESYYGGLHCGECFDVKVEDRWVPVRIEIEEDWYLIGLPDTRLDGLTVRM